MKGKQRDGTQRYGYCKPCHSVYQREQKLRNIFGITVEEYDVMLAYQGGACAICHKPPKPGGNRLAVDHDHKTGLVRGLCCWLCNRTLGYMRDDVVRIRALATYLEEPPSVRALGREVYGRVGKTTNKRRRKRT